MAASTSSRRPPASPTGSSGTGPAGTPSAQGSRSASLPRWLCRRTSSGVCGAARTWPTAARCPGRGRGRASAPTGRGTASRPRSATVSPSPSCSPPWASSWWACPPSPCVPPASGRRPRGRARGARAAPCSTAGSTRSPSQPPWRPGAAEAAAPSTATRASTSRRLDLTPASTRQGAASERGNPSRSSCHREVGVPGPRPASVAATSCVRA
mmetsp:Transcript_12272/g.47373  ORF Transcript_12272/g.47373 Transcript_12272/m.47373 type:complete len:211 (-) Transcript_12272:51-683(-)